MICIIVLHYNQRFEYENIVNTARELGKTRDGVYSDLQKSYIVQQKSKKFIEKNE